MSNPIYDQSAPATTRARPSAARAAPHGKQEYKGNGKHEWERVAQYTERLRVPGGWLYSYLEGLTFVPVPNAVGYAV